MSIKQKRFVGVESFTENESLIFFGRETQVNALYERALTENSFSLQGNAGCGKTSLLRAGFVPMLRKSGLFDVIYTDFSNAELTDLQKFTNNSIPIPLKDTSFYDKILPQNNSLWKTLKKYRQKAGIKQPIVLILDSLEYLLRFDKMQRQHFFSELNHVLKPEIPRKIQSEIDAALKSTPDMLTESALEQLYAPVDVKLCFSITSEHTEMLREELSVFFKLEQSKTVFLSDFTASEARFVLEKTAAFEPTNPQYITFDTSPFKFSTETAEALIDLIQSENKRITPTDLQFAGLYSETIVEEFHLDLVSSESFSPEISGFSTFLKKKYFKTKEITENDYEIIITEFFNNQRDESITVEEQTLLKFIQNPQKLHGIIQKRIHDNGKNYYEIQSEILKKTLTFIPETAKRTQETEKKKNPKDIRKAFILRTLTILIPIILTAAVLWFYSDKKIKNALHISESNLFAAYAFQNLENDPTLSFRLAEKAYRLNPENSAAYSALLNAYYKSEVFYSLDASVDSSALFSHLAPDGSMFVSVLESKNPDGYRLQAKSSDNRLLFEYQHDKRIIFIEIAADTALILFGDADGMLTILDTSGKKQHQFKAHEGMIWNAKLMPDKKSVLTSGADLQIYLYKISGEKITTFPTHDFDTYAISASSDEKYIVTGLEHIDLCDFSGKLIKRIHISFNNTYFQPLIQHLEFSPDGTRFLAVINDLKGQNHTIRVFDTGGNELILIRGHEDWINTAHFSADGKKILSVSRDKTARLQNIENQTTELVKGHTANVNDARFFKNPNRVITLSDDKTVRTWTFGRLLNPLASIPNINQTKFTSDGFGILAVSDTMAFWCDNAGDVKAKYSGISKPITAIDITENKEFVATASKDKRIRLWQQNGKIALTYTADSTFARSICFKPDSSVLVSGGSDGKLIFRNFADSLPYFELKTEAGIRSVRFSPDGNFLLTAHEDGTVVIRSDKGKSIKVLRGHSQDVMSAEFSPDGKYIASTGKDKTARLWSSEGKLLHVFTDFSNPVNSAEFSPDGNYLLTASNDGFVKLYLLTGQEIARFKHHGKVTQSEFSPNGEYILSVVKKENMQTADLQVISASKILEFTNEVKIFGDFFRLNEK